MKLSRPTARLRAAVLLIVAVTALAGCGSAANAPTSGETRPVQTVLGPIDVPVDPQKIVVLNGALAGYLYDLGAPVAAADPRILGVNNRSGGFPPSWIDDAKAQGTEELPTGDKVNLEFVAEQRPDLIIAGGQGFTAQQSINAYDQLSGIAPTVLVPSEVAGWQEQLRLIAETVGRSEQADGLISAYHTRVEQVKATIRPPRAKFAFIQSVKSAKPTVTLPSAALPTLLRDVGFTLDEDVLAKAGDPSLEQAADWFEFSPELLTSVVDAPAAFVIPLQGGRSSEELAADPMYAQLPAFRNNNVFELPALSNRPDYRGVMDTLDLIEERFR